MKTETTDTHVGVNLARRSFFKLAGVGAASVGLLAVSSCRKMENSRVNSLNSLNSTQMNGSIDIGSGDLGVLNYAYALEQLEAAFYTQVVATPYKGMDSGQLHCFKVIRQHEVCHREFFKAALDSNAIPALTPDFSKIDFTSGASVIGTAKAFEDLGVQAYDGAGYLIKNADYLTIAGKIVSVEARHAAYIRNLVKFGDYAGSDVVDSNGLNKASTIAEVIAIANTFLKTKVSASNYGYTA
jgi:hypothetical protein